MRRASTTQRVLATVIALQLVTATTAAIGDNRGAGAPSPAAAPSQSTTPRITEAPAPTTPTATSSPTTSAAPAPPTSAPQVAPSPAVPSPRSTLPDSSTRTLVELQVRSSAEWATVELPGVAVLTQRPPITSGDVAVSAVGTSTVAMALRGHGTARLAVVGEVLDDLPSAVRTCKSSEGSLTVRITRLTAAPVPIAEVVNHRSDGATSDGCENHVQGTVTRADLLGPAAWPPRMDGRRLVLSFYYPWYDDDTFRSGTWRNHPMRPWNTERAAEVSEMVDLASGSGISGFLVSYNHHPATARRFDHVLRAAEGHGAFMVGPLLELGFLAHQHGSTTVGVDDLERWLRAVLARSTSPAWLLVDGRPVVFLYGQDNLTSPVWTEVRQRLRADGLDPFVLGETIAPSFDFDGLYQYSPNVEPDSTALSAWYRRFEREARLDPELYDTGRSVLWAAPVSPGQDDSLLASASDRTLVVERRGGARYADTWAAASETRPDWILVTSWNEFHENTEVAPSRAHGFRPLEQTKAWAGRFATSRWQARALPRG